jgi:hypothetical protein
MRRVCLALTLLAAGASLSGCWHHGHPGSWGDRGPEHGHGGYHDH